MSQTQSSLVRLGRHSSIHVDFQRHITIRRISDEALGVQEVLSRHPAVPLWVTPLEVVKIKGQHVYERFIHCKISHRYYVSFLCWSSGGHHGMLSVPYLSPELHYFLYHRGHLGQPWEDS